LVLGPVGRLESGGDGVVRRCLAWPRPCVRSPTLRERRAGQPRVLLSIHAKALALHSVGLPQRDTAWMLEKAIPLRVTYDDGSGYLYLTARDEPSTSAHTVPLDASRGYEGGDIVVLDFDAKWRLIGIEVKAADRSLPDSLLMRLKQG
jgi:uncharacterized protein YuzE